MPNQIINRRILYKASGIVYDPIASNYFTRAGITDTREKSAVNTLVLAMRENSNIWNSFINGFIYLVSPTSYGASLHNLMSSSFTPTAGVAPSYSTNGWFFDGVSQYLNTNFNTSVSATLNTGYGAFYIRNNLQSNGVLYGNYDGISEQYDFRVRNTSNEAVFRRYDTGSELRVSNTNSSGRFAFSIISNTNSFIRRNEVSLGTTAVATSGSLVNRTCSLGGRNNNGTTDAFVNYQVATFCQGLIGLSTSDSDSFTLMIKAYNDNVISGGR